MDSFAGELAEILHPDDVGVPVTFERLVDPVNGVFTRTFTDPHGIESTGPAVLCRTVDIPGVVHGDTVTIAGDEYKIRGAQHVELELTRLILEAQ